MPPGPLLKAKQGAQCCESGGGCLSLSPPTDQPSTLSPQVPLRPLPPVPGHALVSSHRHLLAALAETRPWAPLVSKGPGDPVVPPWPCRRRLPRACLHVCVPCAHVRSRLPGSSVLPRGRRVPLVCLSMLHGSLGSGACVPRKGSDVTGHSEGRSALSLSSLWPCGTRVCSTGCGGGASPSLGGASAPATLPHPLQSPRDSRGPGRRGPAPARVPWPHQAPSGHVAGWVGVFSLSPQDGESELRFNLLSKVERQSPIVGVSVNIVTVFFYCACFSKGGGSK